MPNVSVYIKQKIHDAMVREASERGIPVSTLIRLLVEERYAQKRVRAERTQVRG